MSNKLILLLLSLLLSFSFILLSKYEDRQVLRSLDFGVTVKVQEKIDISSHLRAKIFIDNLMEGATFLASPIFSSLMVLLLIFLATKNRFAIPVLFLLLVGGEIVGKTIVHHPSPPFFMIKHTTTMFPANYINEQFSYPSGHAARAVFLSLVLFSLIKKRLSLVLGLGMYVLLVSVSRIYLGHHWFSDVVGGLLLGSSLGVLTWMSVGTYNTKTMSD